MPARAEKYWSSYIGSICPMEIIINDKRYVFELTPPMTPPKVVSEGGVSEETQNTWRKT